MLALSICQQVLILLLDRVVAFARCFPEALDVEYLDLATRVFDDRCFLQNACNAGDARSPNATHLSQEFLCEG